jgi:hypothetical protein
MIKCKVGSKVDTHLVKLELKSDIDKISERFTGHTNADISDEIILDTSSIHECEDSTAAAIELFGENTWNDMPIGYVVFHC